MHTFTSHGETIQVELRLLGATLWLAYAVVVQVQGREFYPKLNRIGFLTQTDFDFDVEGKRVCGAVRTLRPIFIGSAPAVVSVEGKEIGRDSLRAKRWYLNFLAAAILGVVLILALLGLTILLMVAVKLGSH